jgi:hypothetical protein
MSLILSYKSSKHISPTKLLDMKLITGIRTDWRRKNLCGMKRRGNNQTENKVTGLYGGS